MRLKRIAVCEEILFIAVAPCRAEGNTPCGQRNAGVAPKAVGIGSQRCISSFLKGRGI